MSDSSYRAVARRLQTAFKSVEKLYLEEWTKSTNEGMGLLKEVIELTMRLEESAEATRSGLPLFMNEEFAEKYEEKTRFDIVELMDDIRSKIDILQEVVEKIRKHAVESWELYLRICHREQSDVSSQSGVVGSYDLAVRDLLRKLDWISDTIANSYSQLWLHFTSASLDDRGSFCQLKSCWEYPKETRRIKNYVTEAGIVVDAILASQE